MALCEYGCLSLDYVYGMSWAEFRIRQYGYNRKQKQEWFKIREIASASIIGPHLDPKKLPSKQLYMPLDKKGVTDKMAVRMKEAIDKYKEEKDARS